MFAKPPVAGRSKTRLARGVGPARAAAFAGAFLRDVLEALVAREDCEVWLSTPDPEADFGPIPAVRRVRQGGGDLGARMVRGLRTGLSEAPWAIALGADSPGLPADRLDAAIAEARAGRTALGPTEDGGFYLLALSRCPADLLDDLPWSAAHTARATWDRLQARGLEPVRLEPWFDVDEVEDLERLRREVPRARAPHTWALLEPG